LNYTNVPASIGAVVSRGKATLRDLEEWYGLEDLYDLLEIIQIDDYNAEQIRDRM
jgi:hypothetical protein